MLAAELQRRLLLLGLTQTSDISDISDTSSTSERGMGVALRALAAALQALPQQAARTYT